MIRNAILLVATLTVIFSISTLPATTLYPTDDMYTDTSGVVPIDTMMLVVADDGNEQHYGRTMMKFDLAPYMGEQIEEALLYIYRFYGCGEGFTQANFYEISEDWNEDTWPATQHISHGNNAWAAAIFNVNGWVVIDVTYLIQAFLDGYTPNYGFVIQGYTGTKQSKFYSKECGQAACPYIEINGMTSAEDNIAIPENIQVSAYPNPFNASTSINFVLSRPSEIKLDIYNILGNKVESLLDGNYQAGNYNVRWNADKYSSGAYFYNIIIDGISYSDKIMLLK